MFKKIFQSALNHKIIVGLITVILVFDGYFVYKNFLRDDSVVRYFTARAERGTIAVSVSGSGQVSAANQVDIKLKAGGEIVVVYAKSGQEVNQGDILAVIDARDAERAVRDAETDLETAQLELEKILEPPDELTLLQAENSLDQAQKTKQKAEDKIKEAYEDGFNSVSNSFLELPGIMAGIDNLLFADTINPGSKSGDNITWYFNQTSAEQRDKVSRYRDDVRAAYNKARNAYEENFDFYRTISRNSGKETVESLISETYDASQLIADTIKTTDNYIDFVQDEMELSRRVIPAAVSSHQSSINSYTGKINVIVINLLSVQRSLKDSRDAIADADALIKERELSLAKIKDGPDDLSIRAKKIILQQKKDALVTAKQNLVDHYIRAPFAGVIAKADVDKGEFVSTGTVVATLITKQKIVEISLNEVDIARIKVGQKAEITFDALVDLTAVGKIIEVDAVGTVSQGVVTYIVKIAFNADDDRIKTAMSVLAVIVTEEKNDVVLIPNSAVKSQGGISYVETVSSEDKSLVLVANARGGVVLKNSPQKQKIEVGVTNDEFTEILGGLNEGDIVITRAIQSAAQDAQVQTQSSQSGLRIPGLSGGGSGGGQFRTFTR